MLFNSYTFLLVFLPIALIGWHADKRVWTPNDPGWPLKPASEWTKVPNRLEYISGT